MSALSTATTVHHKGDDEDGGLEEDGEQEEQGYDGSSSADEELNEKHRDVGRKKRKRGGADESTSSNKREAQSWTKEDDLRIIEMKENEMKSWAVIAECFTGRSVHVCEARYSSVLKQGEKRAKGVEWSNDDDLRIIEMWENEKKSWKDIAKCFTGRSSRACQTRYYRARKGGDKREKWSNDDDLRIIEMKENEKKSWADIAECFTGRTLCACRDRYGYVLKKGEKKANGVFWTNDDDLRIIEMRENGKKSFTDIAKCFTGRTESACTTRYHRAKKGEKKAKRVEWTNDDDLRIIEMRENEMKSWADIAECFPEKTESACTSRYSSVLKKGEKRPRVEWTNDDDLRIIEMKENEMKSWADIAECFTGRTEGACQTRYHNLKKREKQIHKGDSESAVQEEVLFPTPGTVEIDEEGVEMIWL
jgi:broad specificity phosphatase PhoE